MILNSVRLCRCSGCGKHFSIVSVFVKHRLGFRCLSDDEMIERGFACDMRDVKWLIGGKPHKEECPVWCAYDATVALASEDGGITR